MRALRRATPTRPGRRAAAALLLAGGALAPCCGRAEAPRVPPERAARHVLLVVVDTLRADALGAYGNARGTSPVIDALARRGVRCERAVAQSSWTSPSMVSLLTGRAIASRRMGIPAEEATLAERFAAAGFATAAFVTNPLLDRKNGFARGFARYEVGSGAEALAAAREWLRAQAGRPTFTYVHLSEPHDPYQPPPSAQRDERVPVDAEHRALYAQVAAAEGLEQELDAAVDRIERARARYEGEVRVVDRAVAGLLDALREAGELERAAVALTADHGEGLWTRLDYTPFTRIRLVEGDPRAVDTYFLQAHGNQVYEELVRVPIVLAAPALPRGRVLDEVVQNLDLAPTLLELAGLPPGRGLQGRSLVGLLEEGRRAPGAAFSVTRLVAGVQTDEGWKLILPTPYGARACGLAPELYFLPDDPRERRDLAAAEPARVRALSALVERYLAGGIGPSDPGGQAEIERNLEALRKLGYLDSGLFDELDGGAEAPR